MRCTRSTNICSADHALTINDGTGLSGKVHTQCGHRRRADRSRNEFTAAYDTGPTSARRTRVGRRGVRARC